MKQVFIVNAHTPDGSQFALIAFGTREAADKHIEKCSRNPTSDDGRDEYLSAAQMLGISGLTIQPLTVQE